MASKLRSKRDRPRYLWVTSSVAVLLIGIVVPSALARTPSAHSNFHGATRAYLMSGLGGAGAGAMNAIGAELQASGITVTIGSYTQASAFAADACAHGNDRIVVVGFSLGATSGAELANAAQGCGVRSVRLIGIDPPASDASVSSGVSAVNFVGSMQGTISGARNMATPGYSHEGLVNDRSIQARIVAAARSY